MRWRRMQTLVYGGVDEASLVLVRKEDGEEKEDVEKEGEKDNETTPPSGEDEKGCPNIILSKEENKRLAKQWKSTLIVHLLGKRLGYSVMKRKIEMAWARRVSINLIDVGNAFYFVKFFEEGDYEHALTGGPWLIFDHYLAVRTWEPKFKPYANRISKIAAWVRLPRLALEYYDKKMLKSIGDLIGKSFQVDFNTANQCRGKFARICVEVDLDKPLLSEYRLDGELLGIEYEGLHMVCFRCGIYGHAKENCPDRLAEQEHVQEVSQDGNGEKVITGEESTAKVGPNVEEDKFGPWMMVQRWARQNPNIGDQETKDPPKNKEKVTDPDASRYDLLRKGNTDNMPGNQLAISMRRIIHKIKRLNLGGGISNQEAS